MTEQIITITGLEFTTEGRSIAATSRRRSLSQSDFRSSSAASRNRSPKNTAVAVCPANLASTRPIGQPSIGCDWLSALRRLVAAL